MGFFFVCLFFMTIKCFACIYIYVRVSDLLEMELAVTRVVEIEPWDSEQLVFLTDKPAFSLVPLSNSLKTLVGLVCMTDARLWNPCKLIPLIFGF